MNGFQKIIKVFAICLAIFIILAIANGIVFGISCLSYIFDGNSSEIITEYHSETFTNITKIDVDLKQTKLIIKNGEELKVELSNLRNEVTTKKKENTLKITEQKAWFMNIKESGTVTISIPKEDMINVLDIKSGTGKITIDNINITKLDIDEGVGLLEIQKSRFKEVNIEGGTGKLEITNSIIDNLELEAGVGEVNVSSTQINRGKVECGVGKVSMDLLGRMDDYRISIEKGLGSITINDENYNKNTVIGNGSKYLEIEGGVGSIAINTLE